MKKLLLGLSLLFTAAVQAQPFPSHPIRLVVPFPPGGNIDFIARTIQPKLVEALGQPVVIENRGGAGGIVGANYVARQPADGYTILLGNTGTLAIYSAVYQRMPYDPVKDFVGIGMTSTNAVLAVLNTSVPANTLREFVSYAKANPGKISAGVAGSGSLLHLATELLKAQAGIDLLVVPYKGSGPALTDLLGGHVQLLIDAPTVSIEQVRAGKVKAIAVSGKTRLAALPDVPTFDEAGVPGVDASGWQGVVAPAGTPHAIVEKLSSALGKAMADPGVREKFAGQGLDAFSMTADEFTAHIRSEVPKWKAIATKANIQLE
jgi:tripartite-type tricarboxylate transporter receptor subunit TctC